MAACDFVVKYDPEKDTGLDITRRIFYSIFIKRLKNKKPVIMFVSGDSGEGKSLSALTIQQVLLEIQGIQLKDVMQDINVITPLQYTKKLHKILYDKKLKKVNVICMHEARELVKAKTWYSFLTQTIADINAVTRAVKRLCTIIISQFIRDISTDIRYTLNYYIKVSRPLGRRARLYIYVLWKDDRDLEKPKLRKRKLSGYLVYPNGKYRHYIPQYLEVKKPDKEIEKAFNKIDYESKKEILQTKLNKIIKEVEKELETGNNKVSSMVEWYAKHTENLTLIGKKYRGKWKVIPEVKDMHDLTKEETNQFEKLLNEKLKEKGVLEE